MNWQRISTIISIVSAIVLATWWGSKNVVFADEFNSYQVKQAINWLKYDKQSAWDQYIGLRQLDGKTAQDEIRLLELEKTMKDIDAEIQSLRAK